MWGLVAGQDKAIPPECERFMYRPARARKIVEVPTSSHVAMISHRKITADLIEDAAQATCRTLVGRVNGPAGLVAQTETDRGRR